MEFKRWQIIQVYPCGTQNFMSPGFDSPPSIRYVDHMGENFGKKMKRRKNVTLSCAGVTLLVCITFRSFSDLII